MFKLFVLAALMAVVAAKPGFLSAPVVSAYSAPVVSAPLAYAASPLAYSSAYSSGIVRSPLAYSAYSAPIVGSPYIGAPLAYSSYIH